MLLTVPQSAWNKLHHFILHSAESLEVAALWEPRQAAPSSRHGNKPAVQGAQREAEAADPHTQSQRELVEALQFGH